MHVLGTSDDEQEYRDDYNGKSDVEKDEGNVKSKKPKDDQLTEEGMQVLMCICKYYISSECKHAKFNVSCKVAWGQLAKG